MEKLNNIPPFFNEVKEFEKSLPRKSDKLKLSYLKTLECFPNRIKRNIKADDLVSILKNNKGDFLFFLSSDQLCEFYRQALMLQCVILNPNTELSKKYKIYLKNQYITNDDIVKYKINFFTNYKNIS